MEPKHDQRSRANEAGDDLTRHREIFLKFFILALTAFNGILESQSPEPLQVEKFLSAVY